MNSRLMRVVAWMVMATLLLPACASRNVAPIGAGGQPFRPEADERTLWDRAEKEEQALAKRTRAYDDPLLEEYLGVIADRLMPDTVRAAGGPGIKVGVIRDPTLNAFAMPNGRIYVHTGLLSRLENEAQLATILGHELTHVTHRHALRYSRDAQTKQTVYTAAAVAASIGVAVAAGSTARSGDHVGAAVLSQTANAVLGLGLALATVAAIQGYGRDLEREADHEGMEQLVRAGYDPQEAPKVFALLREETGERGAVETFFFGSHPRLQERIETTSALVRTRYAVLDPPRIRDTEDFALRTRTVVRENAYEDIRMGRFALAQRQLDRVLSVTPRDPIAHVYYGDLHRLRSQRVKSLDDKKTQARQARERYERAVELDPALPDPWRQLGFLYYQQKETDRAKAAFEKYLALKPDAPDAGRIREYLLELGR
ncbi:MAG TPA: tetratricopeptide repeat protein [Methylomirabilota bacterium]|nr:tetratricopeptide repeat protein [Methylomirabilota bacterium]